MFESEAILNTIYTSEAQLEINIYAEGGEIPVITEIDGGNSGSDDQFTPINGLLEGGGA